MDRSCDKGKHWDISFVPLESDSAISGKTCRVVGRVKKGMLWEYYGEYLLRSMA